MIQGVDSNQNKGTNEYIDSKENDE